MLTFISALAVALLVACSVLGWTFVILYSRVRWYSSQVGRHLMRFTIELSLTFSLTLLNYAIHLRPMTRAVLSVALFGLIAWDLGTRIRLHLAARREVRDDAREASR